MTNQATKQTATSPKTVRVVLTNEHASGNRKGWTKLIKKIDMTKANGYAFEGDFLSDGEHNLPIGGVLIQKNPGGSVKNGYSDGVCLVVRADGTLGTTGVYDWKKEFLSFLDHVADRFNEFRGGVNSGPVFDAEGAKGGKSPEVVDPTTIVWQDARFALLAQDWTPYTSFGIKGETVELWVHKNRCCKLIGRGEDAASVCLTATHYVDFTRKNGKLVPVFPE